MQGTFRELHLVGVPPEEDLRPWLQVRRALKRRQRRSAAWSALLGLVLVLSVGIAAGWWLSTRIEVDLTGVSTLPEETGFVRTLSPPHPQVGYVPGATDSATDNERSSSLCDWTACVTSQ